MKQSFSFRFIRNLGLMILAGFIVLSSLLSYYILERIAADFKTVMTNQLPSLNGVIQVQSEFSQTYPHFQKFINDQDDHYILIVQHLDSCRMSLLQMEDHTTPEEKVLIEKIVKIIKQIHFALKTNRDFVLYDAASSNSQEMAALIIEKVDDANAILNDLAAKIQIRVRTSEGDLTSHVEINKKMLITFLALALLISLCIIIVFNRALAKPINRLMDAANKIAAGDDFLIEKVGTDEFGQLMNSFNEMSKKLVENRTADLTQINISLIKEIDNRKRAEENLRASAAKLEQSIKELQQLNFIASHDLREPLRKITMFGDRLQAALAEKLDADSRDNLDKMQSAVQQLHVLMDGLLMISRVTTKAQPFATVDLNTMVPEISSELEVITRQPKGCIAVGDLPMIDADPAQMRQLFDHLIGNALKFRKKEEAPQITISARTFKGQRLTDAPYDELCQITIEDNGIGFDEKYLDRIFGVFQQLHGRNEYGGSGMGLAICKKIVDRHNGNISAKGSPGKGATLIIQLPVKQTAS